MATPTEAEKKWMKRVQRALDACPSSDIEFNAIGDADLTVFRRPPDGLPDLGGDFCTDIEGADAGLGELIFPGLVHSTAG